MRIIIDTETHKGIGQFEKALIRIIVFFYGWWVQEGEVIGYIVGVFHILFAVSLFVLVILCHTLYPAFWLQCIVFTLCAMVVIQHIVLKVCIMTTAEIGLTKQASIYHTFVQTVLEIFHVDFNTFMTHLVVGETIAVICFALELISRISVYIFRSHDL